SLGMIVTSPATTANDAMAENVLTPHCHTDDWYRARPPGRDRRRQKMCWMMSFIALIVLVSFGSHGPPRLPGPFQNVSTPIECAPYVCIRLATALNQSGRSDFFGALHSGIMSF